MYIRSDGLIPLADLIRPDRISCDTGMNLACLDDPGLGLAVPPSVQSSYRDENWLQIGDAEPWNYTITWSSLLCYYNCYGYYRYYANFMNAVGADTWINFTRLPGSVSQHYMYIFWINVGRIVTQLY